MEAKCLDLNKAWSFKYGKKKTKKLNMYDFPVHDYTQDQTGSPYFFLCFNNANGRLYQERFLRSTNFVTMVTLVALLFFISVCNWLNIYHLRCLVMTACSRTKCPCVGYGIGVERRGGKKGYTPFHIFLPSFVIEQLANIN